jgi:hypothetical protein
MFDQVTVRALRDLRPCFAACFATRVVSEEGGFRMIERTVTAVTVSDDGFVTHLANRDENWSPQSTADVMLDLELGQVAYVVDGPEGRTPVLDVSDDSGRYLTAKYLGIPGNGLLALPRVDALSHRSPARPAGTRA